MSRAKALLAPLPIAAMLIAGGCATTAAAPTEAAAANTITLASEEEREVANRADPLTRASFWAKEYNKDPTNLDSAITFAQSLRLIGSHEKAEEVASKTAILYPESYELMMVLGKAMMSQNKLPEAVQVLTRASRIDGSRADAYATLGLAFDKAERHDKAQAAYQMALTIDPGRVRTLSNYGLSLALTGNIALAEEKLRLAASSPEADARVEQNLALVLGLQGKFDEMKAAGSNAPASTIANNEAALRKLLGDRTAAATPAAAPQSTGEVPSAAPTTAVDTSAIPASSEAPALRGSLD